MHTEEIWEVCNRCYVLNGILQNQSIDMENVHGIVDESSHSSWAGFLKEFGNQQKNKFKKIENVFNITQKFIKEHSDEIPNVEAWKIHHHHGRDQHWSMIKRSKGRRQKLVSTQIPFYVLVGWNKDRQPQKDGKA